MDNRIEKLRRMGVVRDMNSSKEATIQKIIEQNDPGRNDLCPCRSGKKYKHCHLEEQKRRQE